MDCALKVTILQDNTATRPGLAPGHGLALLVERGGQRVLFDTGPDASLVKNAAALGVPLSPLAAIVLSHGHADHTGGLAAALEAAGPVPVVGHPGLFDRTFAGPRVTELREISAPLTREEYEARGATFRLSAMPQTVAPDVLSTGHVPLLHLDARLRVGLWRSCHGTPQRDDFRDDCSLVAALPEFSVLMTGCAHPGLANIVCKAQTIAPHRVPRLLLGGLHLGTASPDQVVALARELAELGVRAILPCHCTGAAATQILTDQFRGEVVPVGAGTEVWVWEDGTTEVRFAVKTEWTKFAVA